MLLCELTKVSGYGIESDYNTLIHTKHDTLYSVSGFWKKNYIEKNYVIVEFHFRQNLSLLGFFFLKKKRMNFIYRTGYK